MTKKVQKLLETIDHRISCYERHANLHGENFNIFSILRMERKEVETHSKFIYELLNKKGSHGQGELFLKLFITDVLGITSSEMGSKIKVEREDLTKESDDNRRIDFTLTSDSYVIGIELKIDAGDQKSQLYDYNEEIKNRAADTKKSTKLYYLTLHGKSASNKSLYSRDNTKKLNEEDYEKVSFNREIIQWLNNCINAVSMKHVIREALFQYLSLSEKLLGRRQQMTGQISKILTDNPEYLKSAIEIEKALTKTKINIQKQFWKKLEEELKKELKIPFEIDIKTYSDQSKTTELSKLVENYYKKTKNNKHFGLKFKICNYEKYELCAYFNLYNAFQYGIKTVDKDGRTIYQEKISEKLREKLVKGNADVDKSDNWMSCFYNPESRENAINFSDFNNKAQLLADEKELETVIASIVEHIGSLIESLECIK